MLDAELFEDGLLLGVQLDAVDEARLEAADEFDDLAELLLGVNPDSGEIVADVIAQNAFDEIQIAVQQSGRLAVLTLLLDLIPGLAEEFDVGANFVVGGAARGSANDEAARIAAARFANQAPQARTLVSATDFPVTAPLTQRRHS